MSSSDGDGTSHNVEDVLYLAFIGEDAVPGANGADWDAENFTNFHSSISSLGNKLVKRIGNPNTAEAIKPILDVGKETCSWLQHCKGMFAWSFLCTGVDMSYVKGAYFAHRVSCLSERLWFKYIADN